MEVPLYLVDAFTDSPFGGNPAAVCRIPGPPAPDEGWMQNLAAEMNLSETAFVGPGPQPFSLRWFTPEKEVDLCGHATLASAHVLWESKAVEPGESIEFDTRSGILGVDRRNGWLRMDFPAEPGEETEPPPSLLDHLGVDPASVVSVHRNRMDYLLEVSSPEQVRECEPDFAGLSGIQTRGIILTARSSDASFDFLSRFFAPRYGIDEDPVTGSAHCFLCPFWSEKMGQRELSAYQASRRGGEVRCVHQGERVGIAGRAVTVVSGRLSRSVLRQAGLLNGS